MLRKFIQFLSGLFRKSPGVSREQDLSESSVDDSLERELFFHEFIAVIKSADPDCKFRYDPVEFAVHGTDPKNQKIVFLHNALRECKANAPSLRAEILAKWARYFLLNKEVPSDFEDARYDLLPVIRMRSQFEFPELRARIARLKNPEENQGNPLSPDEPLESGSHLLSFPDFTLEEYSEHFVIALSYDMYDSVAMISNAVIADWGVSFYEAMEIAKRNLEEKGLEVYSIVSKDEDMPLKAYLVSMNDGYESSRLLLDEKLRELEVEGDHIAMIPTADKLFITGSEDMAGLAILSGEAVEAMEKHKPLSFLLLRLEGDEWKTWLPPQESKLHKVFKHLQMINIGGDYGNQQHLLREWLEAKEESDSIIVTDFGSVEFPPDSLSSVCIWERTEKEQWLPVTDLIGFPGPDEKYLFVSWEEVFSLFSDRMNRIEEYPPRFSVDWFPDENEWNELIGIQAKTE